MTKKLYFLLLAIILIGCSDLKNVDIMQYCIDVTLINNEHKTDTFLLRKNTQLEINQYKGAYGLRVKNKSLFEIYGYFVVHQSDGFLKYGCIDFTIKEIKYHHTDTIKYDYFGEY